MKEKTLKQEIHNLLNEHSSGQSYNFAIDKILSAIKKRVPKSKDSAFCDATKHDMSCYIEQGWDACREAMLRELEG